MIKNIFKRSGLFFGGSIISKIFTSTAYILLSRFLTPDKYGQGILSATLIVLGSVVGEFGLNQWYQKQEKEESAFTTYIKLRMILAMFVALVVFTVTNYLHWLPFSLNLITSLALIPYALLSVAIAYLIRNKQVLKSSLWQIIQIAPIFLVIFLKQHGLQIEEVLIANFIGVSLAVCVIFPWHKLQNMALIHLPLRSALRSSSKYALLNYTSVTYARADSILVRNYLGEAALGFYGLAYRYLEYFALFPSALVQILFPIFAQNKDVRPRQIILLTALMGALGAFFALILALGAKFVILHFHGDAYASSIQVMQLLSITLLLFFINAPLATFVQASDLVKKFLPFGVANTILSIVLNIIYIPLYGIIGAAIVMMITELSGLIINIIFTKRVLTTYDK